VPRDLSRPAISGVPSGGEKSDPSVMRCAGPAHRQGGCGSFFAFPPVEGVRVCFRRSGSAIMAMNQRCWVEPWLRVRLIRTLPLPCQLRTLCGAGAGRRRSAVLLLFGMGRLVLLDGYSQSLWRTESTSPDLPFWIFLGPCSSRLGNSGCTEKTKKYHLYTKVLADFSRKITWAFIGLSVCPF
jgi:hypothetical protein